MLVRGTYFFLLYPKSIYVSWKYTVALFLAYPLRRNRKSWFRKLKCCKLATIQNGIFVFPFIHIAQPVVSHCSEVCFWSEANRVKFDGGCVTELNVRD